MESAYAGLRFLKLDLHVHTPASKCFEDKSVTPAQVVKAALDAGLDGIAVTDHNTGDWVDLVKAAAKGTRLAVFPGVEIHAAGGRAGVHVIALLDPSKGKADVDDLLSKVQLGPSDNGNPAAVGASVETVVDTIASIGGLAVLAHANSSKGALSDMQGAQRTRLFTHESVAAVEATVGDFAKERGQRVVDFLSGSDPTYNRRKLAVYVASDNPLVDATGALTGKHSLDGIGAAFTYFKTEATPTLESLRQCFIDPDVRIRWPKGVAETTPEDSEPYPRVVSVQANDGFLKGQTFEFHPGLNTVVGPKGSGKSLLVEFLRFAFDDTSEVPSVAEDHDGKLKRRLGLHGVVSVSASDRTGQTTWITREYSPRDGDPYADATMLDAAHDFPILFLSQGEMVRIAEEPGRQMAFLDQFFDFQAFVDRIDEIQDELTELDEELSSAIRDKKAISAAERRVRALSERMRQLDEKLKDPVFKEFFKQKERLDGAGLFVRSIAALDQQVTHSSSASPGLKVPAIPEGLGEDPSLKRMKDIAQSASDAAHEAFESARDSIREAAGLAEAEMETVRGEHGVAQATYIARARELGGNQQALSAEREAKQADLLEERTKVSRLRAAGSTLKDIAQRRTAKLRELDEVHKRYTKDRKRLCERVTAGSGQKVQVTLIEKGDKQVFAQRLSAFKVGTYISGVDIDALVEGTTPKELVAAILNFDLQEQEKALEKVAAAAQLPVSTVRKLAEHLLSSFRYEDILRFQYQAAPADAPLIKVRVAPGVFEPIDEVSTGQKCTGLIAIALCATDGPVVIDQPEDSLDITGIWDDMCQTLRAAKERQQFILTSHSSNLAVASDTDLYSVINSDAKAGSIIAVGALDGSGVRDAVLGILEGGRQAYALKSKKFGLDKAEE